MALSARPIALTSRPGIGGRDQAQLLAHHHCTAIAVEVAKRLGGGDQGTSDTLPLEQARDHHPAGEVIRYHAEFECHGPPNENDPVGATLAIALVTYGFFRFADAGRDKPVPYDSLSRGILYS